MKVGITIPNLGPQATRENVLQTAIEAEKEGFDSVWTITRILWPLKPQTPYGGTPDGTLPIEYQNALDPLDVLVLVVLYCIIATRLYLIHSKEIRIEL